MDPFKEWVTLYYDPDQITEAKLLKLLHERRCKSSTLDRVENGELVAMNPFVSAGEVVQVRLPEDTRDEGLKMALPDGWKIAGNEKGVIQKDKKRYLSILVPEKAEQKKYVIKMTRADKKVIQTKVEVVRRIPG